MGAGRWAYIQAVLLLAVLLLLPVSVTAYATEITVADEVTEEEKEADSYIARKWKEIMDLAKDFFLGPAYDERPQIDGIKDIDPYEQLGDITFAGGKGMEEAKEVSASFYRLVYAVSVVGLILSFVVGGIRIAWNRSRNKADVQVAIAVKMLAFAAVFTLTGLWGILVPLLKMASMAGD